MPHRKKLIACLLLVCAGVLVYANALPNTMFWDDNDGILNNAYVHTFQPGKFFSQNLIAGSGLESNYWRPVLLFVYSAEWHVWGAWAPGYHAVNVAVHILNALLVFLILLTLFKRYWLSFFTSLVFLIHPVQTEAITYVSGLGDPLSFLFTLIAILCYIKFRDKETPESSRLLFLLAAFAMFPFALMTKERSIILPGFLLLIDLLRLAKERIPWKTFIKDTLLALAPFALLGVIYLLLRGTVLDFHNTFNIYGTANYYTEHIVARIATFLKLLPSYFGLLFAPVTLYMERSVGVLVETGFGNPLTLIGIAILLLMATISFLAYRRGKLAYGFGFLWFLVAFFPSSGIAVPVAGLMYEHYLYAPLVGVFLFLGAAAGDLFAWKNGFAVKLSLFSLFGAWLAFLGFRTAARNTEWRDPVTFFSQTIAHEPGSMRI